MVGASVLDLFDFEEANLQGSWQILVHEANKSSTLVEIQGRELTVTSKQGG